MENTIHDFINRKIITKRQKQVLSKDFLFNLVEQQQQLQQQHQESHQQRHQAFQDHQQKVQQLDFQDQLQHHQQSQQSHLQQHASMQGDAEMHQFENNIYQQYNQPTNLSHGPNMHHQMPQQHQVDIQRDNDPHFQYKL